MLTFVLLKIADLGEREKSLEQSLIELDTATNVSRSIYNSSGESSDDEEEDSCSESSQDSQSSDDSDREGDSAGFLSRADELYQGIPLL